MPECPFIPLRRRGAPLVFDEVTGQIQGGPRVPRYPAIPRHGSHDLLSPL